MSRDISYSDWLSLAARVKRQGMDEETFAFLKECCPHGLNADMQETFLNQVGEMEQKLLEKGFNTLENGLNQALQEGDPGFLLRAVNSYRRNIRYCSFFLYLETMETKDGDRLCSAVCEKVLSFQRQVERYLKNAASEYPNSLVEELLYIVIKRSPVRMVREWRMHE